MNDAHNFHQKLWAKSGEKFLKTKLSFKDLNQLILKLLAPPPAVPKFGLFDSPQVSDVNQTHKLNHNVPVNFMSTPVGAEKAVGESKSKKQQKVAEKQEKVIEKPVSAKSTSPVKKVPNVEAKMDKIESKKEHFKAAKPAEPVVKKEKMTLQLRDATIKLL